MVVSAVSGIAPAVDNSSHVHHHASYGWIIGVLVCLLGSALSNLGLNFQKYSFILEDKHEPHMQKKYYRQWRWWFGLAMITLGSFGDFAALSFAPQSVIMPVGSFTLVCNIFFAHKWLGERLEQNDLIGTSLIICGAVTVAIFGGHDKNAYNVQELMELYNRPSMVIYAMVIILLTMAFKMISTNAEKLLNTYGSDSEEYKSIMKLHPLSYAGLAGTFGAQSVLFAKSTAELIQRSLVDSVQYNNFCSWIILGVMLITILLQTHYLSVGLKYFDALYIVPVFQCFFITLSVLGGAVYFKELNNFSVVQWIMFPFGVLITIFGVIVLSSRDMQGQQQKKDNITKETVESIHPPSARLSRTCSILKPVYSPAGNGQQILIRTASTVGQGLGTSPLFQMQRIFLNRELTSFNEIEENETEDSNSEGDEVEIVVGAAQEVENSGTKEIVPNRCAPSA